MMFSVAIASSLLLSRPGQLTPQQLEIVNLGRINWLKRETSQTTPTNDILNDLERQFAIAQTLRNEELIEELGVNEGQSIQISMANIIKGCCRIGDYKTIPSGNSDLINSRAWSFGAISLQNYLTNFKSTSSLVQTDVWEQFKATRELHLKNRKEIESYSRDNMGFNFEQHMNTYDALAFSLSNMFKLAQDSTLPQKKHLFELSSKMIDLTIGKDPLPFP